MVGRPKGFSHSPATRAKISESNRKAMADPAVRAQLRKAQRARFGSDDIPDHLWADYRTFRKKGYSKAEALKALGIETS